MTGKDKFSKALKLQGDKFCENRLKLTIEDISLIRGVCVCYTVNRDVRRKKRVHTTKQPSDWSRYKKIQKDTQHACRNAHGDFISNMFWRAWH